MPDKDKVNQLELEDLVHHDEMPVEDAHLSPSFPPPYIQVCFLNFTNFYINCNI